MDRVCRVCRVCRNLSGCLEFLDYAKIPYPDYGCSDFKPLGFRAWLRQLGVMLWRSF